MIIYNSHLLNNKQRFRKALIFSLFASIACSVGFALLVKFTHITFSIYYVITGYIIAKVISDVGHGVGNKYRYLGVVMTILSFILTEIFVIAGLEIILHPDMWIIAIKIVLSSWVNLSFNTLITLLFMAAGIFTAFNQSSI